MMLVIGLTGGIGMGKSAAAERFAEHGIPVFNADICVHGLYEGEAVAAIDSVFPGVAKDGRIDRKLLSEKIAGSPERLLRLERIVHPLVVEAELDFLRGAEKNGAPFAVLEIPLLFETGADSRVDVTVVVSAPRDVQRARVLSRPGMTADKLEHLLARQLPDAERVARGDYVVDSSLSLADTRIEIDKLIESLKNREGRVMDRLRRKD
jgi:dephospho-CoA kinase